jgi:hypothetical protein
MMRTIEIRKETYEVLAFIVEQSPQIASSVDLAAERILLAFMSDVLKDWLREARERARPRPVN